MKKEYFENLAKTENGEAECTFCGGKKKIFLIGDSMREGYCPFVKEKLTDLYDVVFPDENCRNTQYVITSLRRWSGMFENLEDVAVVSFNCGHWDIAHWNRDPEPLTTISDYARNIRRIITNLKVFFPKAEILFFTSSCLSPAGCGEHTNPRTNEEVMAYNEAAVEVAKKENIHVADMYDFMKDWGEECFIDYAHLTEEYCKKLGDYVTENICDLLNK